MPFEAQSYPEKKVLNDALPFFAKATKGILRCAKNGGVKGDRTPDLAHAMGALYQLSYDPTIFLCSEDIRNAFFMQEKAEGMKAFV